jgi:hypothetical protein
MELTSDFVIDIAELDLTDVPPGRRPVVVAAFERELGRLVADGPPAVRGDRPAEAGPVIRAHPDGNPVVFGTALARAVHRSLR